jgi:hypothetical protein
MSRVSSSAPSTPITKRQPHGSTQRQPQHLPGLRANSQPNCDLAVPLRHDIGHHAIETHQREQKRRSSEAPEQHHIEFSRCYILGEKSIHGSKTGPNLGAGHR